MILLIGALFVGMAYVICGLLLAGLYLILAIGMALDWAFKTGYAKWCAYRVNRKTNQ